MLKGTSEEGSWTSLELVFLFAKVSGSLLGQLLDGLFLGDEDAGEKRELLAEIAGAAALGYGTKLCQLKAVILEDKTGGEWQEPGPGTVPRSPAEGGRGVGSGR